MLSWDREGDGSDCDGLGGWGTDSESICGAFVVRLGAVACVLAGGWFPPVAEAQHVEECPRAAHIASFWRAVLQLGGFWIALDVAASAFCLSGRWLARRISHAGPLFGLVALCLGVYGAANYALQLGHPGCLASLDWLMFVCLTLFVLFASCWCWLIEHCGCFGVLGECLEALGLDCCSCGCLPAFPEHIDRDDVAEKERLRPSDPSPTVFGRRRPDQLEKPDTKVIARRPPLVHGEIRVLQGGRVVHVGNARKEVRRWIRRNLRDRDDVTVLDGTPYEGARVGQLPQVASACGAGTAGNLEMSMSRSPDVTSSAVAV